MKRIITTIVLMLPFILCNSQNQFFTPDAIWLDNNGLPINAHDGGLLIYNNTYYWYGVHYTNGKDGYISTVGVRCYSSKNLYEWKDEGVVLPVVNDSASMMESGCVIERPKVIYCKKTGKFVMWFHHELKSQIFNYRSAKTGLAIADSPTGLFEYKKSVNPNANQWPLNIPIEKKCTNYSNSLKEWSKEWIEAVSNGLFVHRDYTKGQMSRDMTVFVDDNDKAYHIHASEENLTLHVSELTDDYTDFTGRYVTVMPTMRNEAPTIFKRGGKYYMITSGCTGWAPNAARSFVADNIFGPWTYLGNPCRGTEEEVKITFGLQGTYIFENPKQSGEFILMSDKWNPDNLIDSRHAWLPIEFENDKPILRWIDSWSLDK